MGVMACSRIGCREIMCHLMVTAGTNYEYHYVCTDCFRELEKLKESWPEDISERDMLVKIQEFLDSDSRGVPHTDTPQTRDEIFERLVRRPRDD